MVIEKIKEKLGFLENLEYDPITDPDIQEDSFWILGEDGKLHQVTEEEEEEDYVENSEAW